MTKYTVFIQKDKEVRPVGLSSSEAEAIGQMVLAIQDAFADLNTDDDDMKIRFGGQDGVNKDGMNDGFKIEASCCYGKRYEYIDGFALKVED